MSLSYSLYVPYRLNNHAQYVIYVTNLFGKKAKKKAFHNSNKQADVTNL